MQKNCSRIINNLFFTINNLDLKNLQIDFLKSQTINCSL